MKSSSATIIWNGQDIPDDYLKKALGSHNRSLGIAIPDGKGAFAFIQHWPNTALELPQLKDVLSKLPKEQDVLLVLQDAVKFDDDVGPYPILKNADGVPILVAALDGDFSAFAQETSHAPETFAVAKIKTKAEKVFNMVNGDLVKLMDALNEDEFFGEGLINMIGGDRGSITLMSGDGAFFAFKSKSDKTYADTDFGYVSNSFEVAAEQKEKPSLADSIGAALGVSKSSKRASALENPSSESKEPKEISPGVYEVPSKPQQNTDNSSHRRASVLDGGGAKPSVAPSSTDGKVTNGAEDGWMVLPIPATVLGDDKKLKTWLTHRIPGGGPIPSNWKTMKELKVHRSSKNIPKKFLADYGTYISAQRGLAAVAEAVSTKTDTAPVRTSVPPFAPKRASAMDAPAPAVTPAVDPAKSPQPDIVEQPKVPAPETKKDTDTHHITSGQESILKIGLTPAQKTAYDKLEAETDFKAGVDRHCNEISDPNTYAAVEKKYPNLAHQLGKKSLDEINWGMPEMFKVAKVLGLPSICLLAFNRHFELKKAEALNYQLMEEIERLKTTTPVELKATGTDAVPSQQNGVRRRASALN